MSDFSALLDDVDDAIDEHLCDDALYTKSGGAGVSVRIMIDHPIAADRLQSMSITRSRPVIRVSKATCPELASGDFFHHGGDVWEVAEAPTADGDGRWWVVEVMPG